MAFYGCKFTFDGVSCDEHQLMIYNVGNSQQGQTEFAHTVSIQDEVVGNHWKPLFFGVTYENKLEGEIVFGLNQERIDRQEHLTRQEMANISSWLAGHQDYKWLEIEQDDLIGIRYRCMVTELKVVETDGVPWAFSAVFTCDSPYAYRYPETYTYAVEGDLEVEFDNKSDHNGYYYPVVTLASSTYALTDEVDNVLTEETSKVLTTGGTFSIENITDGRTMTFNGLPTDMPTVTIDCEHGVISASTQENMYKYFNFRFLRLKRGLNKLRFTGNGAVAITCEFPVSVGM